VPFIAMSSLNKNSFKLFDLSFSCEVCVARNGQHWFPSQGLLGYDATPYSITIQKTPVWIFTTVKTSNLNPGFVKCASLHVLRNKYFNHKKIKIPRKR
jgi:hypothetical protein